MNRNLLSVVFRLPGFPEVFQLAGLMIYVGLIWFSLGIDVPRGIIALRFMQSTLPSLLHVVLSIDKFSHFVVHLPQAVENLGQQVVSHPVPNQFFLFKAAEPMRKSGFSGAQEQFFPETQLMVLTLLLTGLFTYLLYREVFTKNAMGKK